VNTTTVQTLLAVFTKTANESHPCNAAAKLREAIQVIEMLLNQRDSLQRDVRLLLSQQALSSLKAVEHKAKEQVAASSDRYTGPQPRIWFKSAGEHPLVGVSKVVDAEGDDWVPVEAGNPEGKWRMESDEGEPGKSFTSLVEDYAPIVDISPGVPQGHWTDDEPMSPGYIAPEGVGYVCTPDKTYTRVGANRWRHEDSDDDEVKDDGYLTFADIVGANGIVWVARTGPNHQLLTWHRGEEEPHASFEFVRDPEDYYWQREGDVWICPYGGSAHAECLFGMQEVTWDELLNHFGKLKEYWRGQ